METTKYPNDVEVWKNVNGFEDRYAISTFGRVKRLARWKGGRWKPIFLEEMFLSLETDKDGYRVVTFIKDGKYSKKKVHRLVAQHFIENPNDKPQVNHIDSNRANNHIWNLEWVTSSENAIHGFRFGNKPVQKIPPMPGAMNPRALRLKQYDLDGNLVATFDYMKQVQEKLGLSVAMVRKATKGYYPSYKGFIWKSEKRIA